MALPETGAGGRRRSRRLELRATPAEREVIDRAAAESGTDLTDFVIGSAVEAAQRLLADRERFTLAGDQLAEWEALNRRPARELPGLRRLMTRPTPFVVDDSDDAAGQARSAD